MRKNGLYLRLSIADGDLGKDNKDESNSIDNQRTLLVNFVQDRDDLSDEYIEYVDDGYSGTNFERPAFKRMIEDAKTGKIDTIIVKDFSRFGRDYIGVGDYLEQVLPILGIRFISLNNNYDSNDYLGKTMGIDMAIHNLVNNLYSKDISKKLKSALRVKWKNGQWTGGKPPFGYLRDSETGEWLIDPVAGKYVRTIFDKAIEGCGTSQISYYMNEQKIPMIDYAHNAMALESLLTTLKEYHPHRLVCLFGCGGNRSKLRRYEMGEVAGKLADLTIITSDNPRDEEPQAIIDDIKIGMAKTDGKYVEIADRKEAIAYAIHHGEPGDIIVLAGKGHEDYQEIKGKKYPMDERVLIADILAGK